MLQLQLIGHLGKDATIKEVSGKKVINFTVAHTEKYKNAQGVDSEKTTWIDCGLWEKTGVAPYLKKGTQVYISGSPSVSAWKKDDGTPAASLRLTVFQLQLLGGKKDGAGDNGNTGNTGSSNDGGMLGAYPDDDLPF